MLCNKCERTIAGTEKWYHFTPKWMLCWGHDSKLSELPGVLNLEDSDLLLVSDMSQQKSVKVTLGQLKEFLKS